MIKLYTRNTRNKAKKIIMTTQLTAMALLLVFVVYGGGSSSDAAQLADRKLTQESTADGSTSAGQGLQYTFDFDLGTTGNVGSIAIDFCTTPLGSCTAPSGMDASSATLDTGTDTINAVDAGFSDGTNDANTLQVTRTPASGTAGHVVHLEFDGVDNPDFSSPFTSFYARITVYSDASYTSAVDTGTVAGAVTQSLQITGRVQERLEFCVAALGDGDATPTDCSNFPTDTDIDIGIIDDSSIAVSPVADDGFNGANDKYGVAMVDTNASNGVVVSYFPEEASTGTEQLRNFRVTGEDCNASEATVTDPCFQSADSAGTDMSATGERFGMHVACVDRTESENSTANLINNQAAYRADNSDVTCQDTEGSTTYAWDNSGTAATLASSTTVVNDEMLKIRFAARAAATTPTGSYTATATFIATATF